MLLSLSRLWTASQAGGRVYKRRFFEGRSLLSIEVGALWCHSVHCWQKFSSAAICCQSGAAKRLAGKLWQIRRLWSEWQLRWRGCSGLQIQGFFFFLGGGVGGQRFGIRKEQQRCSCASAPWHFPNLITDEDRLPSLYLASTFPNLHRRISVDKARLGKCRHPLENSYRVINHCLGAECAGKNGKAAFHTSEAINPCDLHRVCLVDKSGYKTVPNLSTHSCHPA